MSRNRLDPQHHQKRIERLQGQLPEKILILIWY